MKLLTRSESRLDFDCGASKIMRITRIGKTHKGNLAGVDLTAKLAYANLADS